MKLYMHPVSTACRPIMLFAAESGIDLKYELVDLMTGAHCQEPFRSLNPNKCVPVLEDEGFVLTESSAILKYLADKTGSPAYPKDLRQRARVNELMDWFNTGFYRDFGYGLAYPQLFGHHKRPTEEAQKHTIEWGRDKARSWLEVLDQHTIGPKKAYLTGDAITIADYFGAGIVTVGELLRCDFGKYPNVARWLGNVKQLKSWPKVNEAFYGFVEAVKTQAFVAL